MNLLAFIAVAMLIIFTPGRTWRSMTRNALAHGRRAALFTGSASWSACWCGRPRRSSASSRCSRVGGGVHRRQAGGSGVPGLSRHPHAALAARARRGRAPGPMPCRWAPFRQGLLTNLLNPKIAVLFTSLIPQFVSPGPRRPSIAPAGRDLREPRPRVAPILRAARERRRAWLRRPTFRRVVSAVTGRSWWASASAWPRSRVSRPWQRHGRRPSPLRPVLSSVPTQTRANGGSPMARVTVVNDNPEFLALGARHPRG